MADRAHRAADQHLEARHHVAHDVLRRQLAALQPAQQRQDTGRIIEVVGRRLGRRRNGSVGRPGHVVLARERS